MPTAQDVLNKKGTDVAVASEEDTVKEAARNMSERRIGALAVVSVDRVIGIFTERDVMCRVVAAGLDPGTTRVKDVMTTPVAVCQPTSKLAECRSVMTEKRIRHLPIVNDNRLVGMLSAGDILANETQEKQQTIEYLQEYLWEGTR